MCVKNNRIFPSTHCFKLVSSEGGNKNRTYSIKENTIELQDNGFFMTKLNRIKVVLAERDLNNKWLADKLAKDQATVSKCYLILQLYLKYLYRNW